MSRALLDSDSSSRGAPPRLGRLTLGLLTLATLFTSGCGLTYRTSRPGSNFVLFSDRDDRHLDATRDRIEEIYEALLPMFDLHRGELGTTRILLDGHDEGVIDHSYAPSLLGYYVPFFNVIRVDTIPAWARGEDSLEQVLLHEITHHFFVTRYPDVASRPWLNEGLAGALEVSQIQSGRFDHPLLHPVLVRLAQRSLADDEDAVSLCDLISKDWEAFHESADKVAHYALSWSIVYYLLSEMPEELPLSTRIDRLYRMESGEIIAAEDGWRCFLTTFDLTNYLVRAVGDEDRPLRATWAARQIGELYSLDDRTCLSALSRVLAEEAHPLRSEAVTSMLRLFERNPHLPYLAPQTSRQGLEHLERILRQSSAPADLRGRIVRGLSASTPRRAGWIRSLVPLLEDNDPQLRTDAARALARLAAKPTILNPRFWQFAPASAREAEVGEWKAWLGALER